MLPAILIVSALALAEGSAGDATSVTIALIALVVNTVVSSITLTRAARSPAAGLSDRVTKLETEMHNLRNRELQRVEIFMDRIERRQRRSEMIVELIAARLRIQTPEPVVDYEDDSDDDGKRRPRRPG